MQVNTYNKRHKKYDNYNKSGALDITAKQAIDNVTREEQHFNYFLKILFSICDICGYEIVGRIVVKDKKTGQIWK